MKKSKRVLEHHEFETCRKQRKLITVYFQGEPLQTNGIIQEHTEYFVIINGDKFLKTACEFRITS
ncbi:hypothetical protein [Paenibacillus hexagrammi]|uniref:Uncharacterized protein n=1 Tax=Paenibacillus hexagrammi TaxID=2908839 RepID=A0ABY3SR08_9BACL|nr:hypothetical protein [Paenibacillus sp. YPD9-1]UJF35835.1 hypothetical protein L0M14_12590 [Paenibacillus sp. YPD9-1]